MPEWRKSGNPRLWASPQRGEKAIRDPEEALQQKDEELKKPEREDQSL